MKRQKWLSSCAAFICLWLAGCWSPNVPKALPKSEHAAQVEKLFPVPFEEAWARIVAFGSGSGRKIVTADKASGLVTFVLTTGSETKIFYNVLLQPSTTGSGTMVVVFERTGQGAVFDSTILDRISGSFTN